MPNSKLQLLFLLFTLFSFAQEKTIIGVVTDTLNQPLERANVIAKPLQENASLKFSIADHLGRYKLELDASVKYEVKVSYIGYKDQILIVEPNSVIKTHNFILKESGETLKEIVITYEYKPIIVKKDTLIYDVAAFVKGNERKMKEVLEKLPGVEVDKNGGVTVQGKKVTQMLVEGKLFFGGGSKLAVENLPADAIDKIEVIDNFNQVGFLKQVSDSEDLAMNVKLKEDKKKFLFGDVDAGAEVADDNEFHLLHSALFYYSPKTNVSFIGDVNNIGQRTFSFDDLTRFQGGISSFMSNRPSLTNLYSFVDDNKQVVENKSQFAAINFRQEINSELDLDSFAIFSKLFTASASVSTNEYLQNSAFALENRTSNSTNKALLGIGNMKLNFSPNKTQKIYYNAQFQANNNDNLSTINSTRDATLTVFETLNQADNSSFKQFLEWHKQYKNSKHTTTFVVNQTYEKSKPQNTWLTDTEFLTGLIPLQNDVFYNINQIKNIKNNTIDALLKHYWILDNFNHLYTNVGANIENSSILISEKQFLTNGTINDFANNGFGNDLTYQLNDVFLGLEYKFKIGKWINKPGIYVHSFYLKTQQISNDFTISKTLFQPQWDSEYEFNNSESLKFNYKLTNNFADASQMMERFTLKSYNSVFKGNALLNNEQFHTANINYSKTSMYRGIFLYAFANFTKKTKTIRNEVEINGINQFTTPILTDNPETTWSINGSISKKVYRFRLGLNTNIRWFNYFQNLNGIFTSNDRNSQNVGFSIKTATKKWPSVSINYNKGFSQFNGITKSTFETDTFSFDFDIDFLKSFTFKTDYEITYNTNSNNVNNQFKIANASLMYHKKNNPLTFELTAQNYLNNGKIINNSFSDFIISNNTTFILPRIFMFTISYKL